MSAPTIGQLEREISNRIRSLYNVELGLRPTKINCHFFHGELAITLENSVTKVEQILIKSGSDILAEQVRIDIDRIIVPQIQDMIEEVIDKPVLDLISHTNLRTGRTGIIVFIENLPEVRNPQAIPKARKKNVAGWNSSAF
ncbi:hypothetical protein CEN48_19630 [Fischerella thermalis CCMEE 5282]|uniref:DUF2294 domain-containing protein n=1 Tax=Fischerella thermalis TaxID=372787 RepID=UPI000C7FBE40|nr:DUF2294 domain-containing protein [Fischerella thermalis]PMB11431.1 hypothetical protein CEN48_19630 [Fischerella thermalis CCMEE 5282]